MPYYILLPLTRKIEDERLSPEEPDQQNGCQDRDGSAVEKKVRYTDKPTQSRINCSPANTKKDVVGLFIGSFAEKSKEKERESFSFEKNLQ